MLFNQAGHISTLDGTSLKLEVDIKTPFPIPTISKWRGGCHSLPQIAPLILYAYLIRPSVKQGGIKYHFFGMTRLEIETYSPGPFGKHT